MAIQMRNKRNVSFNTASMSDLVFLLLIFFMLTSTLVAPNAIKLLLPSSESRTMAKQTVTVYLNEDYQMFLEETPVTTEELHSGLLQMLAIEEEGSVVLRADQTVPVQYIVNVIDVVNSINNANQTRHKVILATQPAQ
ncbi:MAG: biopolymer transporter ExbD [Bacteroidales bacterium]|jgi:biopolymer transport protein ExbD|nr:biopolymer transporter ExbD [Bacteroidales bacterium]NLM93547.1 biopolymer transporter ExbD [Bacteroidales bacterium]